MTEQKPEPGLEVRKKSDAEKQREKDAMINLWMGDMSQDAPKELEKDDKSK